MEMCIILWLTQSENFAELFTDRLWSATNHSADSKYTQGMEWVLTLLLNKSLK